ncbi:MAG TPA: cation-translocating P-type ATPase [Candidatus Sulfotelmatobacter sp.]|nr:cation-translocating P-type ATPase [Candidatus Sulfotelmatobacter sp.]
MTVTTRNNYSAPSPFRPDDAQGLKPTNLSHVEGDEHSEGGHEHGLEWIDLVRIGFVLLAALAVWFRIWEPFSHISVIGILATVIGGYPIFREAFENILERKMTMELSMTIALLAALAIGEFFTALVITGFVLAAEVLEGLTVGRGRTAIRHLIGLLPTTALVRRNGAWQEVETREIAAGDAVLVKPGARIPVDGTVTSGHSFVDQSTITGESMPTEKVSGALVYAGTINQSGALEIQVVRLGRDTTFGKIIEAVERAEKSRAPIQGIADRLAGYLVYFALGAAAVTFLVTHNVRSTISVVIVAGACGIAAGTPLAILGAIGRSAQLGAIIKGGIYLESLANIHTVLLDKTGTLTYGTPEVVEVHPAGGTSMTSLLQVASLAEARSEHPMAKAIMRKAANMGLAVREPDQFEYTPGKGVVASRSGVEVIVGNRLFLGDHGIELPVGTSSSADSEIFVASEKRLLGTLMIADTLRPEATTAIQDLKSMGMKTVLLTGDAKAVAEDIGRKLGVDEVAAELLPEDKLEYVSRLTSERQNVIMVGDGVNDAPALMKATVGIAMGAGTDVARESANVVLIGNDLSKLVETLLIARRCRRTITQNFVGTLAVDTVGVGLAAFGFLNPLLAAFIHVSSEMAFILNSARLLPPISSANQLRGILSQPNVAVGGERDLS